MKRLPYVRGSVNELCVACEQRPALRAIDAGHVKRGTRVVVLIDWLCGECADEAEQERQVHRGS